MKFTRSKIIYMTCFLPRRCRFSKDDEKSACYLRYRWCCEFTLSFIVSMRCFDKRWFQKFTFCFIDETWISGTTVSAFFASELYHVWLMPMSPVICQPKSTSMLVRGWISTGETKLRSTHFCNKSFVIERNFLTNCAAACQACRVREKLYFKKYVWILMNEFRSIECWKCWSAYQPFIYDFLLKILDTMF